MNGWHPYFRFFTVLFAYWVAASMAVNLTITSRAFHNHSKVTLGQMIYGTAHRPFVYRAFPPAIIRAAIAITPDRVASAIRKRFAQTDRYRNMTTANGYETGLEVEFVYSLLLMLVSLVGVGFVMREIIREFVPHHSFIADWVPPFLILSLPIMVSYFIYDFTNLFLFTLCLLFVLRSSPAWLYAIFPLSCLTKETSVLILPLVACLWWRGMNWQRLITHLSCLGAIWIVTTCFVRWYFRDNPGVPVEWHLVDHNLPLLLSPLKWMQFDAFFLPRGVNIGLFAVIGALVYMGWRDANQRLRLAFAITTIAVVGMVTFGAFWDELRVYYETVPLTFVLMVLGVKRFYDRRINST